ncbi:MAG: putative PIG3 family NAD(P)H quinone oxidoreductase [Candidatus Latescibacterota bacterium]|jgi:putative PIG3 family NAD(P)H quinone oxidoreductase
MMKAVCVDHAKEGFPLSWADVPDAECKSGEVLVDIHATAVNRADLLQRAGNYPVPSGAPPYMGLEMAGVVADVGEDVTGWQVGDRVCALLSGGGYAEKVSVPQELLMHIPDDWSFEQAAAVPEVFYTAFVNLFMEGELQEGETVLIHGGASGVGTAGIQMAHQAGCKVIVTAGREDKVARCLALGADVAINYKERDFAEAVREVAPDGVDVVLDISGGEYLERNVSLLKRKGRLVIIALLGGANAEINLGLMLRSRLRVIGSVLRSRSLEEKVAIKTGFEARFWPLLVDGTIQTVIDTVLPIAQVADAHDILTNNQNIGKVIMTVRDRS